MTAASRLHQHQLAEELAAEKVNVFVGVYSFFFTSVSAPPTMKKDPNFRCILANMHRDNPLILKKMVGISFWQLHAESFWLNPGFIVSLAERLLQSVAYVSSLGAEAADATVCFLPNTIPPVSTACLQKRFRSSGSGMEEYWNAPALSGSLSRRIQ